MNAISKKYYYRGYECIAAYQSQYKNWLCVVENITEPFEFDCNSEASIQASFEYQVEEYEIRCDKAGIVPRKRLASTVGGRKGIHVQDKERKEQEEQQEREFNKTKWRYVLPAFLFGIPAMGYAMLALLGNIFPFTIFFPYRANVVTKRLPILTILVCFICIVVFIFQRISNDTYKQACEVFREQERAVEYIELMNGVRTYKNAEFSQLSYLRRIKYPEVAIRELATDIVNDNSYRGKWDLDEVIQIITTASEHYNQTVPRSLTEKLTFKSNRYDVVGAYTSTFAHASWSHIIFNLVFFFAFAASVELLAGHAFFLLIFAITPIFIAMFFSDSFVIAGDIHGNAALGLSGLCMAFLGCLLVLKPKMEIKTVFWFLYMLRTYNVPILFLAAWYTGWDLVDLIKKTDDNVGHIAHFVGACTGAILALGYRVMEKSLNHEALEEETES